MIVSEGGGSLVATGGAVVIAARAVLCLSILAVFSGCGSEQPGQPAGKPKVFVCRHCDYEAKGGGLTDRGREQAAGIAARLKNEKIDRVLHSPVKRCAETARIVGEKLGVKQVRSADWLREDSETADRWESRAGGGSVLLVTHQPVIRQMTQKPNSTKFGVVTRLR